MSTNTPNGLTDSVDGWSGSSGEIKVRTAVRIAKFCENSGIIGTAVVAIQADDHVRVNAIAPGRFFSRMTEYASRNKAQREAEIAAIPLHRWGGETDLAGVAILLASGAGAFITGEIIRVDGGATLLS